MKRGLDWLTATSERRISLALFALCAMIYIPLAGNYGMWDPWETHYGEVARQMLERNDFVSQWWPGSPQDRQEFWSKPVLTFWLMAISMKLFGLEWGAHPPAAEMADSWRVEWASRLPFIVLGIAAVWATWELVRRLAGRRAGALAAVVLATSAQWLFITRQAMTDMAFVSPMTIALAFAGLGLLLPEEERERELPRRSLRVGRWSLSYPHAPAFYVFAALFVLTTLPQLLIISVQVHLSFHLGASQVRMAGVVAMLPYIAAFLVALWWCARAHNKRQLYLFSGYVLCALASLAKGPAGVALPAMVLLFYLVLAGRWREILTKLEIPRGVILFVATAFPWYHAMLIRHGMGFWNEFIGDNYVHRAGGRHGDRGMFDYYIEWVGYGMFPWSGIVALGSLLSFKKLRDADPRKGLIGFALVWFLVEFSTMSLVNTKFHHYILPALPALAILAGVMLDDILRAPQRIHAVGLLLIAAPITFLCGRDLTAFPPRLLWLFNYDYVNMPGSGRPWPLISLYGDRYEYGTPLLIFTVVATTATVALAIAAALGKRSAPKDADAPALADHAPLVAPGAAAQGAPATVEPSGASYGLLLSGLGVFLAGVVFTFVVKTGYLWYGAIVAGLGMMGRGFFALQTGAPRRDPALPPPRDAVETGPYREAALSTETPPADSEEPHTPAPANLTLALLGGFAILLAGGILIGPSAPKGAAPVIERTAWLLPALLMLPALALLAWMVSRTRAKRDTEDPIEARPRWLAVWMLALIGVVWSAFVVDKLLIELSPHWSQKHVIASYYAKRKDASEPLIAWQLYWRGENFYTKNAIYADSNALERTVFLGDHNAEKMQAYFTSHGGRRVFFVVERTRLESLRALLPAAARTSLTVVDETNNKIYLAVATLP